MESPYFHLPSARSHKSRARSGESHQGGCSGGGEGQRYCSKRSTKAATGDGTKESSNKCYNSQWRNYVLCYACWHRSTDWKCFLLVDPHYLTMVRTVRSIRWISSRQCFVKFFFKWNLEEGWTGCQKCRGLTQVAWQLIVFPEVNLQTLHWGLEENSTDKLLNGLAAQVCPNRPLEHPVTEAALTYSQG